VVEPKSESVTLLATSIGFAAKEVQIQKEDFDSNTVTLVTLQSLMLGEVVVVGTIKRKIQTVPLMPAFTKDTVSKSFKIYPNPVQSNSTLNIEWNQKVAANTIIQLFTQSGQMVFIKELNGNSKVGSASIQIPVLRPGNYFLKATNRATGQSHTEKLVIE
jgi:hypothetical protein